MPRDENVSNRFWSNPEKILKTREIIAPILSEKMQTAVSDIVFVGDEEKDKMYCGN